MTSTAKVLIPSQDAPNANTLLYTSPVGGKGTWIDKATALNHTASAAVLSVNVVPSAGVPGTTNLLIQTKSIAPAATDLLPELVGKFLNPGDSIYALGGTASAIAFAVNGRELT